MEKCEEVRVCAVAGEGLRPRGTPGEDDGAADGDVKGRRMRLAVVVVVDDEGADEVAGGGGERGDGVAILLAGGDWEEAECLFVLVVEAEWLGDDSGSAAGEETVGKPRGVE